MCLGTTGNFLKNWLRFNRSVYNSVLLFNISTMLNLSLNSHGRKYFTKMEFWIPMYVKIQSH